MSPFSCLIPSLTPFTRFPPSLAPAQVHVCMLRAESFMLPAGRGGAGVRDGVLTGVRRFLASAAAWETGEVDSRCHSPPRPPPPPPPRPRPK